MINPSLKTYPAPVASDEDVAPGTSHAYMIAMVGANKRVLEFGCASGYMSARLKAAGCHVTGIDADPLAIAQASLVCDETIVADLDIASLEDILPAGPYDVIVFGDVLEHLRDPWNVLDRARTLIAPDGYAVLSIPNIAHGSVRLKLLDGEFDYTEVGILDDTHLRFFTLRSIEDLCLRAGYQIETIERTKVELFADTPLTPVSKERLVDPALVEKIRRDPEHDTLQFVVRARPVDDARKFDALAKELAHTRERLRISQLETHEGRLDTQAARREVDASVDESTRLSLALRALESKHAQLRSEHGRCADVEANGERERATMAAAIAQFLGFAERELANVRTRSFDLDAAIVAVRRSRVWAVKRFLGALRR